MGFHPSRLFSGRACKLRGFTPEAPLCAPAWSVMLSKDAELMLRFTNRVGQR